MVYTVYVDFEWDPAKARANKCKHGVEFADAATAFDDPAQLVAPDAIHTKLGEVREWLIGSSDQGVLVVVFTRRMHGRRIRIISARKASRKERRRYEELKRISV